MKKLLAIVFLFTLINAITSEETAKAVSFFLENFSKFHILFLYFIYSLHFLYIFIANLNLLIR